jgi:hypothetical protein
MKWMQVPCVLALSALGSCGLFRFGTPASEEPVSPDDLYLPGAGGSDRVDVGPDQESLFETLEKEKGAVRALEEKNDRLTSDLQRTQSELNATKTELTKTREALATQQHDSTELATAVQTLETKVLILQIRHAQAEQAKILMRLGEIRSGSNVGATPGVRR